jgi:TatD DNase family protein
LLIDTHCHLDFTSFEDDRDLVIKRAKQTGVSTIINPGIDLQSSAKAILLAETYPEVYAAVGVHPNSATSWDNETIKKLHILAEHPKVVAIGEIGLDYYRKHAPADIQARIFITQLNLAADIGKPVIIHNRQASQDMVTILTKWKDSLEKKQSNLSEAPGVLHSFSGDRGLLQAVSVLNFLIGISGPVTFKNSSELQEIVRLASSDMILLETDAPFLAPHPHRGARNEPAHLRYIAEKIAELRHMEYGQVIEETWINSNRLFHL